MISKTLSLWIAQSESWQTFIDFSLPEDSIAKYPFLNRYDDFYISLIGQVYEVLESKNYNANDILSIAKGLEVYSLIKKRDSFKGVSQSSNILFAAGLYYLADFSASAYILARLFSHENYTTDIEKFVSSFLSRSVTNDNPYSNLLIAYLATGDRQRILELLDLIKIEKGRSFKDNAYEFSVCFLAESIFDKFSNANIWNDLLEQNTQTHWADYVEKSVNKIFPVWDFFPSQRIALARGILKPFKSLSLQTPTSSGKTAICELLIYNEYRINPNSKILYLAPFRALAAELKHTFGRNLSRLGISSKTIYGGNIPTVGEKELIQNVTLLISTPEKFMAIENSIPDFLNDFNIIICDEGHLINDGNRGLSYELLLSRLKSQGNVDRKFVFISAIIPNISKINSWLGGTEDSVVTSNYRATEIEYGFLRPFDGGNRNFVLDVNPYKGIPQNYKLNKFLTANDFNYAGKRKERIYPFSSVKVKSVAIALKALNSGSVALFTPTKGGNSGVSALASEMIDQIQLGLKLPKPSDFVKVGSTIQNDLKEYFTIIFGSQYSLCRIIAYGALYHHGDLPQYVREVIEDAIRKEEIKLVICTNTLAEGVNLPIRTIVVNSARRYNATSNSQEPLNLRDLKNLVGRAGRAGKETKGLVIVVNPSDFGIFEQVINNRNIEDVNGYLYFIINRISKVIEENRLTLTNDILDAQNENFKRLIDSIDISLIDLLAEEIKVDELEATVKHLIDQTFAKFQANENEDKTLSSLVALRGERLKPIIESGEFKYLKQSGATLRSFTEVQGSLELDNPIWETLADSSSDEWLDFLLGKIVFKLVSIDYELMEFNTANKTAINFDTVKSAIKLWINGSWFAEIASLVGDDIDIALRLINSFVGYKLQSSAAAIIRNVELRFGEQGKVVSVNVLNFPQNLVHGLKTSFQLDLIEIGFNDRIGIIALSKYLEGIGVRFNSLQELKVYLRDQRDVLLEIIQRQVPKISFDKTANSFLYLGILNMN